MTEPNIPKPAPAPDESIEDVDSDDAGTDETPTSTGTTDSQEDTEG